MSSIVSKELEMPHFEWNIPHVPKHPNIVVTCSRNQFSGQFGRLGLFPILSGASTSTDFAKRVKKLLSKKQNNKTSQKLKVELSKILFGKQNSDGSKIPGLISTSKVHNFKKHLDGIVIKKLLETLRKPPAITPTDMRMIFEQLFSLVGRSAGSRLAGVPLTILDESTQGIKTQDIHDFPNAININYKYGNNNEILNNFALSPRKIVIGQPYADNMQKASKLVMQAIDIVSRKLDEYIVKQKIQKRKIVSVEKVVEYALKHVNEWILDSTLIQYEGQPSRTHQQMDFFLIPTVNTRKVLIEDVKKHKHRGIISISVKELLQKETQKGNLRLVIFDISGGGYGTGLSESIAKLAGYKSSGYMDAYIESLISGYEIKMGRRPKNIVLSPRKADLTLAAFEYIPFVKKLRKQGIQAEIILAEQLEEVLCNYDEKKPFRVKTWNGKIITPELIAKRFTFLGEGQEKEGDRGHIYTGLPEGVVILPSPVSRIPASDKRVNGVILEALQPQLRQIGVDVIPSISLSIVDRNSVEKVVKKIIKFGEINKDEYPEIKFLGLILKVDDKRPGRKGKGDEVVSAYPISAGIIQKINNIDNQVEIKQFIHSVLFHRINNLIDKGVQNIIVQPNLLTIFADGKDFMETKIIVYSEIKK